ncbi:PREDICTED: c-C motif chemokine 3 [Chrysochloris asiatica]|uniref:C-C motif chemokine n=1 Tax=Chrysochloris asiatica TaxID=185453 RepID=A0A9B0WFM8_CHRAS|nr:PREDICTED: c-C motif chemokine 3 [Chrysochloris asiatica]
MKVPVASLAILLSIAALCTQAFSTPISADIPTACCFTYVNRQILKKFVASYYETSSQCSKPAIIFITKKNRQICADPREAWVQEYITNLKPAA